MSKKATTQQQEEPLKTEHQHETQQQTSPSDGTILRNNLWQAKIPELQNLLK